MVCKEGAEKGGAEGGERMPVCVIWGMGGRGRGRGRRQMNSFGWTSVKQQK